MKREINTNGENVKNRSTFAYRSCAKLSNNRFNVNPSRPATKPKIAVDMVVTTVNIKIQTKNMMYLDNMNLPLDIGIVSMDFNVCSLYSLPKR